MTTAAPGQPAPAIRVVLPVHLRTLAGSGREVTVEVPGVATQRSVLDSLEERYPMLRGTIRERTTGKRRPYVRFYACEDDLSNDSPDEPLPEPVVRGAEPFIVLGAMSGG